jgi:hypothetical protein
MNARTGVIPSLKNIFTSTFTIPFPTIGTPSFPHIFCSCAHRPPLYESQPQKLFIFCHTTPTVNLSTPFSHAKSIRSINDIITAQRQKSYITQVLALCAKKSLWFSAISLCSAPARGAQAQNTVSWGHPPSR